MRSPVKAQKLSSGSSKRRSESPVKGSSKDVKGKGKGKEKQRDEVVVMARKPGSQLKAGWKLQPLSLSLGTSSTPPGSTKQTTKHGAVKAKSAQTASKELAKSTSSPVKRKKQPSSAKAVTPKPSTTTIEILSDSDDDIQELPVASTSKVKHEASVSVKNFASSATGEAKAKRQQTVRAVSPVVPLQVVVNPPSQERASPAIPISRVDQSVNKKALSTEPMYFDLDENELEEDDSFTQPLRQSPLPRATGQTPTGQVFDLDDAELLSGDTFKQPSRRSSLAGEMEPITFDDDDIFDDNNDDWEDSERFADRRRSGSLGGMEDMESMYGDGEEDESFRALAEREERGGSDDDILELMEREDGGEARSPKRPRLSESDSDRGGLKPLSTIRRSLSPAAGPSKITTDTVRPNAFTAIMLGNNLDKAWADAAESEKAASRRGFIRPAPFYKVLDGMTIAVDAFKYGKIPNVDAYFLSHAHSDHYTNLSASWSHGPIYCSIGTANLIKYKLAVKDEYVHAMPFDEPFEVAGIKCTLIDANHCPGSSIFVFEGPHTAPNSLYRKTPSKRFRYLHCGDFRASPAHLLHPALKDKKVDICYLDTTYLNPKYCFPAQEQVVDACAELIAARVGGDRDALMKGSGGGAMLVRQGEMMRGWLNKAKKEEDEEKAFLALNANNGEGSSLVGRDEKPQPSKERLLVVIGTYSIGKERIVKGVARAINAKVFCDQRKREIFECQDDPELMSMVTDNPLEAQIHVTWLGQIKVDLLSDYLDQYKPHFSNIIGLRPTGWTFKPEGSLALTLKNPSVIQMLGKELQRKYNPSWMTPTKDSTKTVEAYGVPYSEHSSFAELTCFAVSMDCARFIPTVNVGSAKSRSNMATWFERWMIERKRRKAAGEPAMVPHRTMHYW